jgi:hypothetical protein
MFQVVKPESELKMISCNAQVVVVMSLHLLPSLSVNLDVRGSEGLSCGEETRSYVWHVRILIGVSRESLRGLNESCKDGPRRLLTLLDGGRGESSGTTAIGPAGAVNSNAGKLRSAVGRKDCLANRAKWAYLSRVQADQDFPRRSFPPA